MKYSDIETMCRPIGRGVRGCPHDGLGCTGGEKCSINSRDPAVSGNAWNATQFGPDFICGKRQQAERAAGSADEVQK